MNPRVFGYHLSIVSLLHDESITSKFPVLINIVARKKTNTILA